MLSFDWGCFSVVDDIVVVGHPVLVANNELSDVVLVVMYSTTPTDIYKHKEKESE